MSVWWITLGIIPERIQRGCPRQNGRHERMHRTLKKATTRPAAGNLLAQQQRFDQFMDEFNGIRPHEALGQRPPDALYTPSERRALELHPRLEYPLDDLTTMISTCGHMATPDGQGRLFLSTVFAGLPVGLRELDDGRWLVSFASLALGHYQPQQRRFEPAETLDFTTINPKPLAMAA